MIEQRLGPLIAANRRLATDRGFRKSPPFPIPRFPKSPAMSSLRRREWMTAAAAASLAIASGPKQTARAAEAASPGLSPRAMISTQSYPWRMFAKRDGNEHVLHSDALLSQIAASGISGYEPIFDLNDDLAGLADRLDAHGLKMPSAYVNSALHDETQSEGSVAQVLEAAKVAKRLGASVIVTNPSPIRWGGTEDKSDRQLSHQAEMLDGLGSKLREIGMTLAYHNHDAELRQGGREFHHMLAGTDPENVKLCLDAHWVFRGCGNSAVAVMDAMRNYENRIVELHLRQSTNGFWDEVFTLDGDIDYRHIFDRVADAGLSPHLVLEQSIEAETPHSRDVVAAHRQSQENLQVFLDERFG